MLLSPGSYYGALLRSNHSCLGTEADLPNPSSLLASTQGKQGQSSLRQVTSTPASQPSPGCPCQPSTSQGLA